jgi:spermidine synthase
MDNLSVSSAATIEADQVNPVPSWRIFLVSVAALYLELVLIRWAGTEVRVFAYVQNLVLVTCFLGFGVGCLRSKQPSSVIQTLRDITLLVVIVSIPIVGYFGESNLSVVFGGLMFALSNFLTLTPDAALWGFEGVAFSETAFLLLSLVAIVVVAILLVLIASSMVPLGQWVGHCFDHSPSIIRAYTFNLAGSLVGTWLLLIFALLHLPPAYWIAAAFLLVLAVAPMARAKLLQGGALLLVTVLVLVLGQRSTESAGNSVFWSPYQKLTIKPQPKDGGYTLLVNNTGYMSMYNTSPEFKRKHLDFANNISESSYDAPFRFLPATKNVLIVGSGAGNDVSAALRNGASHVDAVEIDPMIYKLGKQLHPDRPYDSDKVMVTINDARNFLRTTKSRYDAIIFGLLDSHVGYSGYSNMRVDNYVYTKDALAQARRLLKPEGVLIFKFEVRPPWLWMGDRFYRTLAEVFGREPVTFYAKGISDLMWHATVFLESDGAELWNKAQSPDLKKFIADHPPNFTPSVAEAPLPATDDWPYPYNRDRSIPRTYLTVSAILLAISLFMVRSSFAYREKRTWTPFLLGTGFMLLETQLVSRLTLYFGSVWIVNGIAISALLCTLVLANIYIERRAKKLNHALCYSLLLLSLVANYFTPWEAFPFSPWTIGLLLSGAYAVSVFLAGLIFSSTLQMATDKSKTLGANVIGAVAGGLLQNVSFLFGLKSLLLMAAACYAGSALFSGLLKTRGLAASEGTGQRA